MKMTFELPDDLVRQTKATAAIRGESLEELVTEALQAHLERLSTGVSPRRGWQSVFGQARREEVEPVDVRVTGELDLVEPDEWR
jgi:hypothetical protein